MADLPHACGTGLQADGSLRTMLPLPGIGSVNGFSGQRKHSQAFFKFTSFTEPGAIYRRAAASCFVHCATVMWRHAVMYMSVECQVTC